MQADAFETFEPASNERESLLETQLSALWEQLSSQDVELAQLRQQSGLSSSSNVTVTAILRIP